MSEANKFVRNILVKKLVIEAGDTMDREFHIGGITKPSIKDKRTAELVSKYWTLLDVLKWITGIGEQTIHLQVMQAYQRTKPSNPKEFWPEMAETVMRNLGLTEAGSIPVPYDPDTWYF